MRCNRCTRSSRRTSKHRKRWQRPVRVSYLAQAGRTDEVMRLQKQLATDYPRDYSAQQQ